MSGARNRHGYPIGLWRGGFVEIGFGSASGWKQPAKTATQLRSNRRGDKRAAVTTAPKYWEMIADGLGRAGWTWGHVSYFAGDGRKMFCADAHRGDGRRFIVHAEDLAVAFIELEAQCRKAQALALL